MAKREILTTIKLGGEKEFSQALAGARREMKLLDEQLKLSAAEFDDAGDAQALAGEQARLLSAKLSQQEEIVRALSGAMADAADKWGEGSKQADDYAVKLTRAKTEAAKIKKELGKTEKALDDTADEMDDAGDEAKQLGKRLENDLADGAEDAESDLERLQKTLDDLRNMGAIKIGIELAEKAWEAAQALVDFVNEQRDVVRQRSIVDYQAIAAGYDPEMIQAMIMRAASITGDYEGAQSAYGMMTNVAGMSQDWLRAWSDMLLGADLKFQELEFSGLMEGLQETLSNRVLAGPFLELLERSGYNEAQIDAINEQLRATETLEQAMEAVMTPLANAKAVQREDGTYGSYADFLRMYMAGESELIAAEQAELELAQAMADLGETLQPIATWLTTTFTQFIEWVTRTVETLFGDALGVKETYEEEGMAAAVGEAAKNAFGYLYGDMLTNLEKTLNGGELTAETQAALDAGEKFRLRTWQDVVDAWTRDVEATRPTDDFIGPMPAAEPSEVAPAVEPAVEPPPVTEELKNGWSSFWDAIFRGGKSVEEKQQEYLESLGVDGITTELDDAASDAATSGSNVATSFATGISAGAPEAAAQAQAMVDSINGIFGTVQYPMFGGVSASAAGRYGGMPNIAINLDGRRVGQLITPHVSKQQGRLST